jgi:hypothetical protein
VPAALDWVRGFTCTREALDRLDPAAEARADGRLREMLAAHLSGDGVWFDSRAWIITARASEPGPRRWPPRGAAVSAGQRLGARA